MPNIMSNIVDIGIANADKAFIDDENLRRQGYNVIRDRFTGSADVYDQNNKLVYIKNIGGDITYANEVH